MSSGDQITLLDEMKNAASTILRRTQDFHEAADVAGDGMVQFLTHLRKKGIEFPSNLREPLLSHDHSTEIYNPLAYLHTTIRRELARTSLTKRSRRQINLETIEKVADTMSHNDAKLEVYFLLRMLKYEPHGRIIAAFLYADGDYERAAKLYYLVELIDDGLFDTPLVDRNRLKEPAHRFRAAFWHTVNHIRRLLSGPDKDPDGSPNGPPDTEPDSPNDSGDHTLTPCPDRSSRRSTEVDQSAGDHSTPGQITEFEVVALLAALYRLTSDQREWGIVFEGIDSQANTRPTGYTSAWLRGECVGIQSEVDTHALTPPTTSFSEHRHALNSNGSCLGKTIRQSASNMSRPSATDSLRRLLHLFDSLSGEFDVIASQLFILIVQGIEEPLTEVLRRNKPLWQQCLKALVDFARTLPTHAGSAIDGIDTPHDMEHTLMTDNSPVPNRVLRVLSALYKLNPDHDLWSTINALHDDEENSTAFRLDPVVHDNHLMTTNDSPPTIRSQASDLLSFMAAEHFSTETTKQELTQTDNASHGDVLADPDNEFAFRLLSAAGNHPPSIDDAVSQRSHELNNKQAFVVHPDWPTRVVPAPWPGTILIRCSTNKNWIAITVEGMEGLTQVRYLILVSESEFTSNGDASTATSHQWSAASTRRIHISDELLALRTSTGIHIVVHIGEEINGNLIELVRVSVAYLC